MTPWNQWPASERSMGIGIMIPIAEKIAEGEQPPTFANMLAMAQAAEAIGCDSIWLADHILFRPPVADEGDEFGCWEAWTAAAAAALAQATSHVQIGLLVTCIGWRSPGIVARMTETIDEISNGRFILGVGAGWHEPEYTAFGFPFDHRASRFEDSMIILDGLFRTGQADHRGEFFSVTNAVSRPRGPRGDQGGSPILVGTNGKRMLGLTAKYADAWNTCWHAEASQALPDLALLDAACAEVGRDPATVAKTAGGDFKLSDFPDAEAFSQRLSEFRNLGFQHLVANLEPCTPETIREFAATIKLLDASDPSKRA